MTIATVGDAAEYLSNLNPISARRAVGETIELCHTMARYARNVRGQRRCDQAGANKDRNVGGFSDHHHNQGYGKRCRRDEVRKTVADQAVTVVGAAIFSFTSVQVLRTSAVINVQFSISTKMRLASSR